MSQLVGLKQPWNSCVLGTQDLSEIVRLAPTLPGNWRYVADVMLDPSGDPLVWLYSIDEAFSLSIGFAKVDGLISVTVVHDSGRRIYRPVQFPSVTAAFASLFESLGKLQERRERNNWRWRLVPFVAGGIILVLMAIWASCRILPQ